MSTKLSWEPVRHATVYCAPACGSGCTLEEHDEAVRKAAALAKKLGPAWEPNVWENMGWHYNAVCGSASVSPMSSGKYWSSVYFGGKQFMGNGHSPLKALAIAVAEIDAAMELWQRERQALRRVEVK